MYLFDTDHITALDRGGEEGERLRARLAHVPPMVEWSIFYEMWQSVRERLEGLTAESL